MNFVTVKCPNCGAEIQVDADNKGGTCQYCGSKIINEDAVGKTNTEGAADGADREFESRLVLADNAAKLYFERGPKAEVGQLGGASLSGYNGVMNLYNHTAQVGACESRYWLHMARFYYDGNMAELDRGASKLPKYFISDYEKHMGSAAHYAVNDEEKQMIMQEKETYLLKYQENQQDIEDKTRAMRKTTAVGCVVMLVIVIIISLIVFKCSS